MDTKSTKEAARKLAAAWLERSSLTEMLADDLRPKDRQEAYAIQDEMAAIIGEPVGGWKMGATSPAIQRREGHSGPIIGRVFRGTIFESPASLPAAMFPDARVEGEFGIRFLEDMPPRQQPYSVAEIAAKVELVPTIEIIGNRFPKGPDAPRLTTHDEIADNGTGMGLVIGKGTRNWSAEQIQNLTINMSVDGLGPAENVLGDDRCIPLEVAAETVNILSRRGITLEAGQIVSTGGCTIPQHVARGSSFVADYGELGRVEGTFV
ncbi:2-keto-4-pentenoate hydratase [Pseudochelatococcus sp. B33]